MIFSTRRRPWRASSVLRLAAAGLAVASLSCANPSSSSGPAPLAPSANSSSSVSIKSASPVPSASPVSAVCPYGSGTLEAECRRRADQALVADVNAAIDRLAERRPELFDLARAVGPGQWRVLQPHAYLAGLVDELRTAGFCAETDQ